MLQSCAHLNVERTEKMGQLHDPALAPGDAPREALTLHPLGTLRRRGAYPTRSGVSRLLVHPQANGMIRVLSLLWRLIGTEKAVSHSNSFIFLSFPCTSTLVQ